MYFVFLVLTSIASAPESTAALLPGMLTISSFLLEVTFDSTVITRALNSPSCDIPAQCKCLPKGLCALFSMDLNLLQPTDMFVLGGLLSIDMVGIYYVNLRGFYTN